MACIAVLVSNPCKSDARVIKMARAAAEAGYEVHVFGTMGQGAALFEHVDGVNYHRLEWKPGQLIAGTPPLSWLTGALRPLALGIAKRLTPYLKYRLFSKVFVTHVAGLRPSIVHAHDLICLKAAHDAAAVCGAAVVYDAHELETHRNPPLPMLQKRWVLHVERRYGRKAAAVNTVGKLVGRELASTLGRADINVLYNSPPIEPCARSVREDLAISPVTPLVIYVGKVTIGRGVAEVLKQLPKMEGVFFAAVGPCDEATRTRLDRQAELLGVAQRFRLLPPVPFSQVVSYIRGADLGVISVEPITLSYRYCMPNKLFELSFANVPILSNRLDEIEEYLAENRNGEVFELDDETGLPYKIFRMLKEKEKYIMDEHAMSRVHQRYSWRAQELQLLSIYNAILQENRAATLHVATEGRH